MRHYSGIAGAVVPLLALAAVVVATVPAFAQTNEHDLPSPPPPVLPAGSPPPEPSPPNGTVTLPQAPYLTGPSAIQPPQPTPNDLPTAG